MHHCLLIDIPLLPYPQTLDLLRGLAAARAKGQIGEALILTSHPPVITLGRRGQETDLLLGGEQLGQRGVMVERVERGGLVTAHGPGQLMIYPVMHLPSLGLGVARMVNRLEQAGIEVCAEFGVIARRREDHPGLWLDSQKIASVGLAVKRGVTLHGMALYNRAEPELFGLINPCGLCPEQITSLEIQTGRPVEANELRSVMADKLAQALKLSFTPWPLKQALETIRKYDETDPQTALA